MSFSFIAPTLLIGWVPKCQLAVIVIVMTQHPLLSFIIDKTKMVIFHKLAVLPQLNLVRIATYPLRDLLPLLIQALGRNSLPRTQALGK